MCSWTDIPSRVASSDSEGLKVVLLTQQGLELTGVLTRCRAVRRAGEAAMKGGEQVLMFVGTPRVDGLTELKAQKLTLTDLPNSDLSVDFILLAEQFNTEVAEKAKISLQGFDSLDPSSSRGDGTSPPASLAAAVGRSPAHSAVHVLDMLLMGQRVSAVARASLSSSTLLLTPSLLPLVPQLDPQVVAEVRDSLLQAGDKAWQPQLDPQFSSNADDEVNQALQLLLSPRVYQVGDFG